jgi:hypothetical protein
MRRQVSQRCGRLSVVLPRLRPVAAALLVLALAAPAAQAAGSAPAAAPVVTAPPQTQAPGSAFGPLQPLNSGATTPTTTTINTTRPNDTALGHGTLLLLVGVAILMIIGVGVLIWYEGKTQRAARKQKRQRLRSGRTPQPQAAGGGRRGPPPPPRKRSQASKRKKR